MDYIDLIDGMRRFGSSDEEILLHGIGITAEQVSEHVVIAPWWEPSALPLLGEARYISASDYSSIKVWEVSYEKNKFTYIKTGIGAPVLIDAVLSLGVTRCSGIIFIGSAGSLDAEISIGDIIIPEYSICGDGASRYIASDSLKDSDCFGERTYPDRDLYKKTVSATDEICKQHSIHWHVGRTFSIDTIFAQFAHIDEILGMGCNSIEMETAAAFRAAKIADIPITAIFSVSDNTVVKKSLVSGRTYEEMEYRKTVRKKLFPKIIHRILS